MVEDVGYFGAVLFKEQFPAVDGGEVEAEIARYELLLFFGGHDWHVLLEGECGEEDVACVGSEHFAFACDEPACVELWDEGDEASDWGDADG